LGPGQNVILESMMTEVAKILARYSGPLNLNSEKAELLVYAACLIVVLAVAD
jgi:hypothetical protein